MTLTFFLMEGLGDKYGRNIVIKTSLFKKYQMYSNQQFFQMTSPSYSSWQSLVTETQ